MQVPDLEGMLKAFHEKYGHLISDKPTLEIPESVKRLRYMLVLEEVKETVEAMGFFSKPELPGIQFEETKQNLVEIADGIADSVYVLIGTAVSYGIPFNRVFTEVQRSNMTKTAAKVEPGQKYGTKTPKGPGYMAPDIDTILFHPERKTALEILYEATNP